MDNKLRSQIKEWVAGSPENNTKELRWQLIDMGIYLDETQIKAIQREILRGQCRCYDKGGDCEACLQYYSEDFGEH